jgi:hypothetical protein
MATVSQLKQKAKELKIKGYSTMSKETLEKALGIPKPSAYRSMRLSSLGLQKPSEKTESKLKIWKKEDWQNLTAKITDHEKLPCGKRGKKQEQLGLPSVCRPTIKINKQTPQLASNFTKAQILKAIKLKSNGERIIWKNL